MRLKVENHYIDFASRGVAQGCAISNLDSVLTEEVKNAYLDVMSKYAALGEHYLWDGDNENELVEETNNLHASLIRINKPKLLLFRSLYPSFFEGVNERTTEGSRTSKDAINNSRKIIENETVTDNKTRSGSVTDNGTVTDNKTRESSFSESENGTYTKTTAGETTVTGTKENTDSGTDEKTVATGIETNKTVEGQNELSPIDARLGDITTPNAKTISSEIGDSNETKTEEIEYGKKTNETSSVSENVSKTDTDTISREKTINDTINDTGSVTSSNTSETEISDKTEIAKENATDITDTNSIDRDDEYQEINREKLYNNQKDAYIFVMRNNLYEIIDEIFSKIIFEHNYIY